MLSTETSDKSGGPITAPGSQVTGAATEVSRWDPKISTGSPFVHCGKIEMLQQDLRIMYDSFGVMREVFILGEDLAPLVRDRFAPPAQVKEIRTKADSAQERVKIGYAVRSASGKALKIGTTTSGGELIIPWSAFLKVVSRKMRSVPVSRIGGSEARLAPTSDIREGLSRGF